MLHTYLHKYIPKNNHRACCSDVDEGACNIYLGSPLALDPIGSMHIYGCQYPCIYLLLHAYLLRGDMGTRLIVSDGGKGLSQFAHSHQCLHVTT